MSNKTIEKLEDVVRAMRRVYHDAIAREIETTSKTYGEIAQQYGVSEQTTYAVARERGLRRSADAKVQETADTETNHE